MNTCCRRVRKIAWSIFAPAFFFAAAGTPAQPVYKEVDAAGHVTYTNRPRPTPPPSATPALTPMQDVVTSLADNSALSSRLSATVDANEAARRLRQVQKEREQGANPWSGERRGQAGSALSDERYQRRREKLRHMVEQAQRRMDKMRSSQR